MHFSSQPLGAKRLEPSTSGVGFSISRVPDQPAIAVERELADTVFAIWRVGRRSRSQAHVTRYGFPSFRNGSSIPACFR
jgi:hypothetical protein